MTEPNPIDRSNSQILRCRYVKYGCVWMTQFQRGEETDARERLAVHQMVCAYRFHEPQPL